MHSRSILCILGTITFYVCIYLCMYQHSNCYMFSMDPSFAIKMAAMSAAAYCQWTNIDQRSTFFYLYDCALPLSRLSTQLKETERSIPLYETVQFFSLKFWIYFLPIRKVILTCPKTVIICTDQFLISSVGCAWLVLHRLKKRTSFLFYSDFYK